MCSPYCHSSRRELAPGSAGIASVKKRRRCVSRSPLLGLRQTCCIVPPTESIRETLGVYIVRSFSVHPPPPPSSTAAGSLTHLGLQGGRKNYNTGG